MLSFLNGGSELGRRIRDHDWQGTPMGPPEQWPVALKALLGVMVDGNQPMFIVWGPEQTLLYNDGYAKLLGDKHPGALGHPLLEVWHEIADDLRPLAAQAYGGTPGPVLDAAIIAQYQRMTHYGITGFGTVAAFAKALKLDDDATKLEAAVADMHKGDDLMSELAESAVNVEAVEG